MKLSNRIEQVEPSRTVRFTTLIDKLRREGRDIINLAVGEPHFEPPPSVIAATKAALDEGKTRYSTVRGLPELGEAIAHRFDGYTAENIQITNGAKQALYSIFQVLCDPGDEVMIFSPFWVSFSRQVELAGGVPRLVPTKEHQPEIAAIEAAVTPRTVALIVNTPNNPTGAVYPRAILAQIVELAEKHGFWLISDEAYEDFVYDDAEHVSLFEFEAVRERLFVVRSFSKSFAMTGFRVGYTAAPAPMIAAMTKFQSHMASNVCTFAQYGALAALSEDGQWLAAHLDELRRKRDKVYAFVSKWSDCVRPQGAFYLFPDVSKQLRPGEGAEDFCADILKDTEVALVPGDAFGMENHIRISYAVADDLLDRALSRIDTALERRRREK